MSAQPTEAVMLGHVLEFAEDVGILLADPLGFVLALLLAALIRSRTHAALVVVNLGLFMELAETMRDAGYPFGAYLSTRLIASALQVAVAYGMIAWWRHRRFGSDSVTAR
jgi:hypothetical protein